MSIAAFGAGKNNSSEILVRSISALFVSLALLSSPGCESGTQPETPLIGMATDPIGDMNRAGADLASGRIEVSEGEVFISVRWAPGTFIPDTSRLTLHLDTDQNPLTGSLGINATNTVDEDVIGSEFMFQFGATGRGTEITRFVYIHPDNWNLQDLDCCISYPGDGLDVRFSLGMLGDDDGLLNFKMVSSVDVEPGGFSGWLDVMPDVGLPATRVEGG